MLFISNSWTLSHKPIFYDFALPLGATHPEASKPLVLLMLNNSFILVGPLFHKLVVNSIQTVTHNTKLFTLTKPVGMDLHAGQFVRVRATIEGR